jgi:hypothetical protein
MTLSDSILLVSALVLLFGGFATGVAMSRVRATEPVSPRYLSLAHQGAFTQAPLLLGVAFALQLSAMPEGFNAATATVISGSALLLFAKDIVNWRTGVQDEFREGGIGYRMAMGFGPLHLAGLVMLAVAMGSGL